MKKGISNVIFELIHIYIILHIHMKTNKGKYSNKKISSLNLRPLFRVKILLPELVQVSSVSIGLARIKGGKIEKLLNPPFPASEAVDSVFYHLEDFLLYDVKYLISNVKKVVLKCLKINF